MELSYSFSSEFFSVAFSTVEASGRPAYSQETRVTSSFSHTVSSFTSSFVHSSSHLTILAVSSHSFSPDYFTFSVVI